MNNRANSTIAQKAFEKTYNRAIDPHHYYYSIASAFIGLQTKYKYRPTAFPIIEIQDYNIYNWVEFIG